MYINSYIILSIILAVVLFMLGNILVKRTKPGRTLLVVRILAFILAIPGFSMILYYFHLVRTPIWYIEFRSISGIEVINGFIGLFAGLYTKKPGSVLFVVLFTLFLTAIPYLKPVLRPVSIAETTVWSDDVCIQSGPTCGPGSVATILRYYGIEASERDIAKECHTCSSGSEVWYLLRYTRRLGLKDQVSYIEDIMEADCPAIIGVNLGSYGHFIAILDNKDEIYIIGDPLSGKLKLTTNEFNTKYKLDGLMIRFKYESNTTI